MTYDSTWLYTLFFFVSPLFVMLLLADDVDDDDDMGPGMMVPAYQGAK